MYVEGKVYRERECLFWRSAKGRHQRIREKAFDMSQDVWKSSLSQKQETRGWESLTKPGAPREQSAAEQKREQRTHAAQKKQQKRLISSTAHPTSYPATTDQSDAPGLNAKAPLPSISGRVREGIRGRFSWGPPTYQDMAVVVAQLRLSIENTTRGNWNEFITASPIGDWLTIYKCNSI